MSLYRSSIRAGVCRSLTRDPKEDPGVDGEREAKAKRNVLELLRVTPDLSYALAG